MVRAYHACGILIADVIKVCPPVLSEELGTVDIATKDNPTSVASRTLAALVVNKKGRVTAKNV